MRNENWLSLNIIRTIGDHRSTLHTVQNNMCTRLTFRCHRCCCFFRIISFVQLVLGYAVIVNCHQIQCVALDFLWNTEPLVMLLNLYIRSNFRAHPYIYTLCFFRYHSLKYYIFTFGHNINNVRRKKSQRSCVRGMVCHRIRIEKPISLIYCSCCCIDNNSKIIAITMMHTNQTKNKLLWPKT